jgi:GcrA cell cycle regulator
MSLPSHSLGWTDARVETLTTLWRDGLSASQIASALGGVTRNAVIGKLHRLGLSGRGKPATPGRLRASRAPVRTPGARVRSAAPRSAGAAAPHAPPTDDPGLVPEVAALTAHVCRWPLGDPRAADFSFCGRAAAAGGPYCADHDRRAHRPGAEPLDRDLVLRRLLAGALA